MTQLLFCGIQSINSLGLELIGLQFHKIRAILNNENSGNPFLKK
jgi:hypothetical protein